MGIELPVPQLVGELVALRLEEELDAADVVLGGVGVRDLLADRYRDRQLLSDCRGCGALDDRQVLLLLPVAGLNVFAQFHLGASMDFSAL